MCTYARTIFTCVHSFWGRRIKFCAIAEDHKAGKLPHDCAMRKPHPIKSCKVDRKCKKCKVLDKKLALARKKVAECRKLIEKGGKKGEVNEDGEKSETKRSRSESEGSQAGSLYSQTESDGSKEESEDAESDTTAGDEILREGTKEAIESLKRNHGVI